MRCGCIVPPIVNGTRVAQDPVTGQTLPAALIGRIVPNSGSLTNGIGQGGQNGVPDRLIEDNGILFAPRFGLTYDITGNQSFIFRARRRHLLRPLRGQHRVR